RKSAPGYLNFLRCEPRQWNSHWEASAFWPASSRESFLSFSLGSQGQALPCPVQRVRFCPVFGSCLVLVRLWLGVAREDFALERIPAIEEKMQQPFPSAEGSPTAAD